jgi:hypothetical protein
VATTDSPESYDSRPATFEHSLRVGGLIIQLATDLLGRATTHDLSKTRPPEVEGFDRASWRLKTMAYDSPEYAASRAELADTLAHHYAHNRHHPEHFGDAGVNGMALVDLVEMLADWKAATERMRTGTGDLAKSIQINKERFGLSDQLTQILVNTGIALGWIGDPAGEGHRKQADEPTVQVGDLIPKWAFAFVDRCQRVRDAEGTVWRRAEGDDRYAVDEDGTVDRNQEYDWIAFLAGEWGGGWCTNEGMLHNGPLTVLELAASATA